MQNQSLVQQVVKVLQDSNTIMLTVKNNPSIDDLTAAIALTLLLNHMNKHALTVFSGRVPSTIQFLQPDMAIDDSTDSLRDFIISLDKSKADKLRYKVEDDVVRIFITPYKASITERDLEFGQGEFNVESVVALGVVDRDDIDQAIMAHGRILHDATVMTVTNKGEVSQLGGINWQDTSASSVSEMVATLVNELAPELLDGQIATALLTGIVSETDRFKNEKTTPQVLSLSSILLAAGANQQLIAEKLETPDHPPQPLVDYSKPQEVYDAGALEIKHPSEDNDDEVNNIQIDDHGNLMSDAEPKPAMSFDIPAGLRDESAQDDNEDSEKEQSPVEEADEPEEIDEDETFSLEDVYEDNESDQTQADRFESLATSDRQHRVIQPINEPQEIHERPNLHGSVIDPMNMLPKEQDDKSAFDVPHPESDHIDQSEPEDTRSVREQLESPYAKFTLAELEAQKRQKPLYEPLPTTNPFNSEQQNQYDGAKQTLSDLEKSVDSPHIQRLTQLPVAQGGIKQEVPQDDHAQPEVVITPTAPEPPLPEPAPTQDAAAPPAVPPPMMPSPMPQVSQTPQFYEPDGSRTNPFLNPKP